MQLENKNWMQAATQCDAPCFRQVFTAVKPQGAKLAICGLGFYELYLNGQKVNTEYFVPVTSDYHPRDTSGFLYPLEGSFTHRTYYDVYDVGAYLKDGKNVIAIVLGTGWYSQKERTVEGLQSFGEPRLTFRLEISGEQSLTVVSDGTMRWHSSAILFNNLFYGEKHDLRLCIPGWNLSDFDDSSWEHAQSVEPLETRLCLSDCPGDKVIRVLAPKKIYEDANRSIYDAGENISGWVKLTGKIPTGETVVIRHADMLDSSGELDFLSAGGSDQIQSAEYTGDGTSHVMHPKFSWQAFRYFEVSGHFEGCGDTPLLCEVVHSDIRPTSFFHCSNQTLNWLYDAYIRTQLSNIHSGVPLDTPNRERLGYTGDGHLGCRTAMLTLDVQKLYKKWIRDILDCQDQRSGRVQHTAPFQGGGGGPAAWGAAIVEIPYQYYINYGDIDMLRECFAPMLRWFSYLESRSENDLVVAGETGGWCLGDWNTTTEILIPAPYVNTYFYIKSLLTAAVIADQLGNAEEKERLNHIAEQKKAALKRAYYNAQENHYCGGVQAADAFAADIGLANQEMLESLNRSYAAMNEFDTGIFGTDILIRVLFENGYAQTAYNLLTADGAASFEHIRREGATTLWESFHDPKESKNHPMFGAVTRYLFSNLLGIQYNGSDTVVIKPNIVKGLDYATGGIQTIHGSLTVKYVKRHDEIEFFIDCTGNINARLEFAGNRVDIKNHKQKIIRYPSASIA